MMNEEDLNRHFGNVASASHHAASQARGVREVLLKLYDLFAQVYPAAAAVAEDQEKARALEETKRGRW